MKQLYLGILVWTLPFRLQAQKVTVATCSAGKGCHFTLSEVSAEEADIVLGGETRSRHNQNDVLVFGKTSEGKEIRYWETGKTRSQIDKDWGGDGYTMLQPFDPDVQPFDGTWQAVYGTVSGSACYVDIKSILQRASGIAGKGIIRFRRPFLPAQLFPSADMKWQKTGHSRYRGVLHFGQGNSSPMKLICNLHLVNAHRIETVYDITIKIPTKGTCTGRIPVTYTCIRPRQGQHNKQNEIDPFANAAPPRANRVEDAKNRK